MADEEKRPTASWVTLANLVLLISSVVGVTVYVNKIDQHTGDNSTRIESLDASTRAKFESLEHRIDREGDQTREALRRIESKIDGLSDKLDRKADRTELRK
jgi:hypothetical protein